MSHLECLDEDGAGRSAEALFLFNDRDGRFSHKKQRPPRNLASLYRRDVIQVWLHVFQWLQEGTETPWHSLTQAEAS